MWNLLYTLVLYFHYLSFGPGEKKLKLKEAANRTKSILHLLQAITPNEKSSSGGQNHVYNQKQVFIVL